MNGDTCLRLLQYPVDDLFISVLESDSRATRESDVLQRVLAVEIMGIELLLARCRCGGLGRFILVFCVGRHESRGGTIALCR